MAYKTQVQCVKEIQSIQKQISFLTDYWNAPGYKELIEQARATRQKWEDANQSRVDSLRFELFEAKQELEAMKNKNKLVVPDDIAVWFKGYIRGMDWGGNNKPYIRWISDDKQYVIVTHRGAISGTGTAMGKSNYYQAPTAHWIAKVGGGRYFENNMNEVEGRLTKDVMMKMQHICNKWATKL